MNGKTGTGRNTNLERLRLVSMLMIVSYHYSIWGFFDEELAFSPNKIFVDLFGMCGWIGILLFVLISGYFMAEGRFTLKKLLTLMGTIWFYTLGALLVFLVFDRERVSAQIVLSAFFPLLRQQYWFMSYYVALMLCSPFLNRLLHGLDRRQHALLCLLSVFLCIGIPGVSDSLAGSTMAAFVTMYLCAAYVRLRMAKDARTGRRCLLLALLVILACALFIAGRDIVWQRSGNLDGLLNVMRFLWSLHSPPTMLAAILLLCGFACRPRRSGGFGSRLGALTVGVYLFQSNDLVSLALWQDLLHTRAFTDSPLLPLHAVGSVLLVFAAGLTLEALRRRFAAPLWARLVDRIAPPLERALTRLWDGLFALGKKLLRDE
ncbi:MAG: acyltransferase family protein [Eubacteriales bacterium]|nr:acyltransferase family protein [Eubacteriales bacterium]